MRTQKKVVLTQGSFDLFHYGHIRFLKRAKEQGDYLIVAVNTDVLYKDYKEKIPTITYHYRKRIIEALSFVDEVIPVSKFSPLYLLKKHKPDVYVICEEWRSTKAEEMAYMKKIGGRTHVLKYLKTISASDIRDKLVKNYLDHNVKLCKKCHREL